MNRLFTFTNGFYSYIVFLVGTLPCLVLFFVYFSGIPFRDDLAMIPVLFASDGDIPFLYQQHNEHQLFLHKVFIWLNYQWAGSTYLTVTLLFNFLFFTTVLVFVSRWVWQKKWSEQAIFLGLFLSPSLYENASWALCSSQHMVIFAFVLLSLYFFSVGNSILFMSLGALAGISAYLSSGNGLVLWMVLALVLIYRKKYKMVLIWMSVLVILLRLLPGNTGGKEVVADIHSIIQSFVWLMSGGFGFINTPIVLKLVVILVLGLQLLFIREIGKLRSNLPPHYLVAIGLQLFCLGTFLGLSLFREIHPTMIPDRYRIYILAYWASFWLLFAEKIKGKHSIILVWIFLFLANCLELNRCKWNAATIYWEKKLTHLNALQNWAMPDEYYGDFFSKLFLKLENNKPLPGSVTDTSTIEMTDSFLWAFSGKWKVVMYKHKSNEDKFWQMTRPNLPKNLSTSLTDEWMRDAVNR